MRSIERILDVNVNRCVEGLRVIEEYARFINEDGNLSGEIRALRHSMRKEMSQRWVMSRDSDHDVGKKVSSGSQLDHKSNLQEVVRASTSRVSESMRVLEEYLKINGQYDLSKEVEAKRFAFYSLEKRVLSNFLVHGLYALTSEGSVDEILKQVKMFIDHEVPWIQYRDKTRSEEEVLEIAYQIMRLTRTSATKNYHPRLIINDYVDIAVKVGAHGVHVGQGDMIVKEVKARYKGIFIGVSTHNVEQLHMAIEDQPDYIALGPIFETKTKMNPEHCDGIDFAAYARSHTDIPLVAIGGINQDNLYLVKALGIDAYAMTASIQNETLLTTMISKIGE